MKKSELKKLIKEVAAQVSDDAATNSASPVDNTQSDTPKTIHFTVSKATEVLKKIYDLSKGNSENCETCKAIYNIISGNDEVSDDNSNEDDSLDEIFVADKNIKKWDKCPSLNP